MNKTKGAEVTEYAYSSRGELLQVQLPDGKMIEYLHDPMGRRIAKKVNGTITEKYLWQGLTQLLAIYDGSNNLLMRFDYADERMPVSMTKGGSTYYLTYDQIGTLRVVSDASGNVLKQINYDTFGNIVADSNPGFAIPIAFAGGLYDRDTGLVRFGFRDYDPDLGRWTAKDPIGFWGGDTDLYGYCLSDPVTWIDPFGLENVGYWQYSQSTGMLSYVDVDGSVTYYGQGYAGFGHGVNNPDWQDVEGVGPIPRGSWYISPQRPGGKLGPAVMDLSPLLGTNTFGRTLFRIHGDKQCFYQSASYGCIILSREIRDIINNSGDRHLIIIR